ncbi:MAG: tetratricopeptide repeat protein [Rhodospirillales bacterium]
MNGDTNMQPAAKVDLSTQPPHIRMFAQAADDHKKGHMDAAVAGYAETLRLKPDFADALNNMGVALRAQGKFEAAVACYKRSLALRPNNPGAWSNMGNALREVGRLEEACTAHRKAVELKGDAPEGIYNLGLVLRDLGRIREAMDCFNRAIAMRDNYFDCLWDRALTWLLTGDYKRGFDHYEWRWKLDRSPPRKFDMPVWDGKDLGGKSILLHAEQGYGDMIEWARFIPLVKQRGAGRVIVECQTGLLRLLATVEGVDEMLIKAQKPPQCDVYYPLLSLPKMFGVTMETLPRTVPYLGPPEIHGKKLPAVNGAKLKVGIVWAGKTTPKDRSCGLEHFIEIMDIPGVAFYSFQKGGRKDDIVRLGAETLITDLDPLIEDFADSAAFMSQLDLVITIDSAPAHLAGAVGAKTWCLLIHNADWRWLLDRDDCPWYPTMRLFRQPRPGDWNSVWKQVTPAFREWAAQELASRKA